MSTEEPTKQKLWGGRFTGKTDPLMHAFNQSLRYDQRMFKEDIQGSIAYTKALALQGILSTEEQDKMIAGLGQVLEEWNKGKVSGHSDTSYSSSSSRSFKFQVQPDDEDIHTANERRLSELIGPLGGKLHTGRSRNDQVATDMRLWLLAQVGEIEASLKGLLRVMIDRAEKEVDAIMPGYTHLQVR